MAEVDLLRAAVMLSHATLEDLLRGLLEWKVPESIEPDALKDVPLMGSESATKLSLAELSKYRDKSVQEVIRESVKLWLERSNYNNTSQVAAALKRWRIDAQSLLDTHGANLDALMKRRHWIVHRADHNRDSTGSGQHRALSLEPETAEQWLRTVRAFGTGLLALC